MSIPFHRNKVVKFWTNYKGKEKYRDFRGDRHYLLFSVDKKFLNFFPITSNRIYFGVYVSKYKISEPRPPSLESEEYPESFVNTSILIKVPLEAVSYLSFCDQCSSFCLNEDFEEIKQLHSVLSKIDEIELKVEYFEKSRSVLKNSYSFFNLAITRNPLQLF